MTVYVENPKESSKISVELINEFSKVTQQKINQLYFYILTMNTWTSKLTTTRSSIIFKNKILKSKSNTTCTGLYAENYKMPMKEKNLNKWRDISCSQIVRLNIISMQSSPNSYRFNAISIKPQQDIFVDREIR